jgi:hypothetical protein
MVSSQVKDVPSGQLDALASNLAAQFSATPFLDKVISGQELRQMMDMQATKDAMDCNDVTCLTEVAGALDAPILITALIAKAGDKLSLSVALLDVEKATVLARRHAVFDGIGAMHAGVAGYGKQLSLKAFGPSTGDRFRQRRWLGWALVALGTATGAANKWARQDKPNLGIAAAADLLTLTGLGWEAGAWLP